MDPTSGAKPIFLLTADLFFRAKIEETAKLLGVPKPVTLASADKAVEGIVLLELGPRTGGVEAVAKIRAASPCSRVVAFGSHVDTETLAKARELGAAEVMPRSRFVRELARILKGEPPGASPAGTEEHA